MNPETINKIQKYFEQLLAHLGVDDGVVSINQEETRVNVQIEVTPEESGIIIGHHGESLQALQKLAALSFKEELGENRLTVNVNNYKQNRSEYLENLAKQIAAKVKETGQPQTLSFLPAHERLVIHTTLSTDEEITTHSEGEGVQRRLVVSLK
jgi:spoIIIJ-associated protein